MPVDFTRDAFPPRHIGPDADDEAAAGGAGGAGRKIGEVTSGGPAPSLAKNIGMGYIEAAQADTGRPLQIDCRGKMVEAEIVKGPFYKRGKQP